MPPKVIRLFMWPFQHTFRILLRIAAEALLSSIGASCEVEVYLVGFRNDDGDNPICIEPENGYYTPEHFQDVLKHAEALYEQDPNSKTFHSHPRAHELYHNRLRNIMRARAIREVLEAKHPAAYRMFVGHGHVVDAYTVHVAIGLPSGFVDGVPALTTESRHEIAVTKSLLEAAMIELLNDAAIELRGPEPGAGPRIGRPAEEMARSAAHHFVQSVGVLAGFDYGTPLYEVLNEVSTMRYEQRVGRGRLLLVAPDAPHAERVVSFRRNVKLSQHRTLRKLVELSEAEGLSILTDGLAAYALGIARETYDAQEESMFLFSIAEQGSWELEHAGNRLLQVRFARPALPAHRVSRDQFDDLIVRVFRDAHAVDLPALWGLVECASQAAHGTMIVISDAAAAEASRLGGQALEVEPKKVGTEHIAAFTAIDGALLVDPSGTLHALGVILDGAASPAAGDPARGARYNSAIRYLESMAATPTVIVLVSEDGMINLLPALRPRVQRRTLLSLLDVLEEEAAKSEQHGFDAERFNRTYHRLSDLQFYLTPSQCETVNSLRKQVDERKTDPYEIRILWDDLVPSDELDDSYFIDA